MRLQSCLICKDDHGFFIFQIIPQICVGIQKALCCALQIFFTVGSHISAEYLHHIITFCPRPWGRRVRLGKQPPGRAYLWWAWDYGKRRKRLRQIFRPGQGPGAQCTQTAILLQLQETARVFAPGEGEDHAGIWQIRPSRGPFRLHLKQETPS